MRTWTEVVAELPDSATRCFRRTRVRTDITAINSCVSSRNCDYRIIILYSNIESVNVSSSQAEGDTANTKQPWRGELIHVFVYIGGKGDIN